MKYIQRQPKWSDKPLYYRCDWELYYMLKCLHRWYFQTLRDFYKWKRWKAKTKFRKGTEPLVCPAFLTSTYVSGSPYCAGTYLSALGDDIISDYYDARHPSEVDIKPFNESVKAHYENLYYTVAAWFEANRGESDPLTVRMQKRADKASSTQHTTDVKTSEDEECAVI